MTSSEVKDFFKSYKELDKIARKILDKFSKAGLLSPTICKPTYEGIVFSESNDVILVIKYYDDGYDVYDYDTISILFDSILNDKVDEYIEERKRELEEWKKAQREKHDEYILNLEKAEYERLKAKFEK